MKKRFNLWNCGGSDGRPAFDPAYPIHPVCQDNKKGNTVNRIFFIAII